MRRIVMFNRVTADGYFAGADGNLHWVVPDKALDRSAAEAIERATTDTILFGRRTYELFEAFWSHALDDPPGSRSGLAAPSDQRERSIGNTPAAASAPDPHDAGQRSPEMRAMAIMLNETPKLVFSRTLTEVRWKNSRLLHQLDPREIEAMKRQPGKDMIIFGSGSIVSQLTQHGLIDEYQFVVCPILLGSGRSLMSGVSTHSKLDLQAATAYPSGNVMLRYARPLRS